MEARVTRNEQQLVTLKQQLELRSSLIKALMTLESIYGFAPSVLTRNQRQKVEMALGRNLDEFLNTN